MVVLMGELMAWHGRADGRADGIVVLMVMPMVELMAWSC